MIKTYIFQVCLLTSNYWTLLTEKAHSQTNSYICLIHCTKYILDKTGSLLEKSCLWCPVPRNKNQKILIRYIMGIFNTKFYILHIWCLLLLTFKLFKLKPRNVRNLGFCYNDTHFFILKPWNIFWCKDKPVVPGATFHYAQIVYAHVPLADHLIPQLSTSLHRVFWWLLSTTRKKKPHELYKFYNIS